MTEFTVARETERLIIRPLKKSDYTLWLSSFEARSPSLHKHDPGRLDMTECTETWFNHLVERHQTLAVEDTAHVFAVFRKEDDQHIGMVDFSTLARDKFQWARIGYTIHNQYWKKGYGKEAVKSALDIAFYDLGFHRIEAHICVDNEASRKLSESVGLTFECIREGFIYENDEWTDHAVYAKNAEQVVGAS
ncbi:GNAT family N-acetyltransferase [Halobacillus litoralis]|uniref:GNAT family N-acetyltransferase n=1 Tax=Halobacillus litoralis TaxID=45668 RepID=UPI001CFD5113|nr:GNAT family protein [Halobacillus litoralis]